MIQADEFRKYPIYHRDHECRYDLQKQDLELFDHGMPLRDTRARHSLAFQNR